eukprot:8931909-Pyramimonas_sp.AAC.1
MKRELGGRVNCNIVNDSYQFPLVLLLVLLFLPKFSKLWKVDQSPPPPRPHLSVSRTPPAAHG